MAADFNCICGKKLTENEVTKPNSEIIELPGGRLAEVRCLSNRLFSAGARPSRSFDGAILSLVDRMCEISCSIKTGCRICLKETIQPICPQELILVLNEVDFLFNNNLDGAIINKLFKERYKTANSQKKEKIEDLFRLLLKRSQKEKQTAA